MKQLAYRRSLGITGVVLLLASLFLVIAGPAAAAEGVFVEGNCNEQNGWAQNVGSGAWGTITNNGDGSVSVNLNAGYSLSLCVKGGSGYFVYDVSTTGLSGPYWPPANCGQGANQCGLSHWAIKDVEVETTTTSDDSTTTTDDSTTTTDDSTTTTDDSTTTTDDSTTTTEDNETTTTVGGGGGGGGTTSTTTTTTSGGGGGGTVTSAGSNTSVLGIQVTAPVVGQVTQVTLPFTGFSTTSTAAVAVVLATVGLLVLAAARRGEEPSPARRWE